MGFNLTTDELMTRNAKLLGLSDYDVSDRRNYVGASDANIICSGNDEAVNKLWKVKTGRIEADNLDDVLPVQLGNWTEDFNLRWYEKTTGNRVTDRQGKRTSAQYPWLRATLDGITEVNGRRAVIDAKHTGSHFTARDLSQRYGPQMHIQMHVTGTELAILSILFGNSDFEAHHIELDHMYMDLVLLRCAAFWKDVQSDTPPFDLPEIIAPLPVGMLRRVDMRQSNAWVGWERQMDDTAAAVKLNDTAKSELKKLIEADVGEVIGSLYTCKRDARGALRFTKIKTKD